MIRISISVGNNLKINFFRQQREKERQKELALRRLAALKAKKAEKIEIPDLDNNRRTQKDTIIKLADQKFEQERKLLIDLISKGEGDNIIQNMSKEQRYDQLEELSRNLKNLPPENIKARFDLLNRAASLKRANRKLALERSNQENSLEDILASLLTDLEKKQKDEMQDLMDSLVMDNDKDIMQRQLKYIYCIQNESISNVEDIICSAESLSPEETSNKVIVGALEDKYDALQDAVVLDILSENDPNFDNLSDDERNKVLQELKADESKVKNLIEKGTSKNDERSKKRKNILDDLKSDFEKVFDVFLKLRLSLILLFYRTGKRRVISSFTENEKQRRSRQKTSS